MDHLAILKKSWGLSKKILEGEKSVESRWYKSKTVPWDRIHKGDTIYFKDSGEPVTIKARVTKVEQFEINSNAEALKILERVNNTFGIRTKKPLHQYYRNKRYVIFIHFDSVKKIKPFYIDKSGYGVMAAWITAPNIEKIKA
jgi:ASC-1-like (ASCH) protein